MGKTGTEVVGVFLGSEEFEKKNWEGFVADSQGSRFLPVKMEFSLATVLTWGFWLWVSDSVKHLETIYCKKALYK